MIIMMMKEKRSKKRTEYLRVFGLRVKGGEREKGLQSMTENERDTKREMMRNRRRCSIKSSTSSSSFIFPLFSIFFGICRLLVSKSISVLFLFLSWCPFSFLVFFLLLFFLHLLFGSKNLFDTRAWNRWQWLQRHQSDIVLSSFLLTLSSTFSVSRLQWISLFRTLEPLLSFPFFLRTRKTLSIFELLEDISFLLLLIFSNRIESLYQPFLCHLYHCCCITVLSSRIPFFKSSRWSCWRWIIKKLERNSLKKERKTIDKTMRVTHKEGGNNKI